MLIIPIIVIFLIIYLKILKNYLITPLVILSTYSLFINFPTLVQSIHIKPLYYNDLEIEMENKDIINIDIKSIQSSFTLLLTIMLSIISGFLFDLWIYRIKYKENLIEILGITGGLLSLYKTFQTIFGKLLIKIFYYIKISKISYFESLKLKHDFLEEKGNIILNQI